MKALFSLYWRALPAKVRSGIVIGGVGAYALLVPVLGIAQLQSAHTVREVEQTNQKLQNTVEDESAKLDELTKDGSTSTVSQQLQSLRDQVIQYRAEQQGRDQVLGLTQYGTTASDPLDTISSAISTIESNATASGITPSPTPASSPQPPVDGTMQGTVRLLPSWTTVDAFESPVASSKIIGQIAKNTDYSYFIKQKNWYEVELSSGKKGWVGAQFVTEK